MSQKNKSSQAAPGIISASSMKEFLDTHPCGDQIRKSVQEQGLAQVVPAEPAPTPVRAPKLR